MLLLILNTCCSHLDIVFVLAYINYSGFTINPNYIYIFISSSSSNVTYCNLFIMGSSILHIIDNRVNIFRAVINYNYSISLFYIHIYYIKSSILLLLCIFI